MNESIEPHGAQRTAGIGIQTEVFGDGSFDLHFR